MEESEASTSQCLVPSPVRPGQEVPPQVSRRVLEYANHLARHRSEVARDMLRLRVPTPDQLARHTAALQVGCALPFMWAVWQDVKSRQLLTCPDMATLMVLPFFLVHAKVLSLLLIQICQLSDCGCSCA